MKYISYSPVHQPRFLPGVSVQKSRVCVLLGDFSFQNIAQYLNVNNDIIAVVFVAH
jgi:rRNA maturation endonuclease Nob1